MPDLPPLESSRTARLESLFQAALALEPVDRARFLEDQCSDDPDLREEVERLLKVDGRVGRFLESPLFNVDSLVSAVHRSALNQDSAANRTLSPAPDVGPHEIRNAAESSVPGRNPYALEADHRIGSTLGQYRIVRVLGAGGMGAVYEAEQDRPRRTVALKVIRADIVSPAMLRRFELEFQALGRLQHPGIAQIYEAGTATVDSREQPFFAMELIRGENLLDYARSRQLGLREKLTLFAKIADAVQHAHQKGVIHRDLKPPNILVVEERPSSVSSGARPPRMRTATTAAVIGDPVAQPKIVDFGVARVIDQDAQATPAQTSTGQLVGTLPYMSPEQVAGNPDEIDTRTDVYSLGVVLYELLCGRLPYDLTNRRPYEIAHLIAEIDPIPLGAVNRALRGDIETIVGKALTKARDERYQSPGALAADIRRFLAEEPILARSASATYQLAKFAQRNRSLVAGVFVLLVVLIGGIITTSVQAARARLAERDAQAAYQRELKERVRADEQKAIAFQEAAEQKSVLRLVSDMLAQADRSAAKGNPNVRVRDVVDVASMELDAGVKCYEPAVEAAVRHVIGSVYTGLGLYRDAEPILAEALRLRRELNPDGNEDVTTSLEALGIVLQEQGNYDRALELHREALTLNERLFGPASVLAAMSHLTIANCLVFKARLDEAEPHIRSALAAFEANPNHPEQSLAKACEMLGNLRERRGDLVEAEELYQRALQLRTQQSPDSYDLAFSDSLNSLASIRRGRGDLQGAEQLLRQSLAIRERLLDAGHPTILQSLNNLAVVLKSQGNLAAAEALYERALAELKQRVPDDHPDVLIFTSNLAACRMALGDPAAAVPLFRRVLDARRKSLGNESAEVASTLSNLSVALLNAEQLAEAELHIREALEVSTRLLKSDHPDLTTYRSNLAWILDRQDRLEEAEPYYREALRAAEVSLPQTAPFQLRLKQRFGDLLRRRAVFAEAENLLREVERDCPPAGPVHQPIYAAALDSLIALYEKWPSDGSESNRASEHARWLARRTELRAGTDGNETAP